jgi:hypothetical protein
MQETKLSTVYEVCCGLQVAEWLVHTYLKLGLFSAVTSSNVNCRYYGFASFFGKHKMKTLVVYF